jgi:Mn-dependent DtxR family transcriptional regulator
MSQKTFVPQIDALRLIDNQEIVGVINLVNYFDMTDAAATKRLYRLHKAGYIEPLGIEKGKWVLTNKGIRQLEYFRRRGNDNRK